MGANKPMKLDKLLSVYPFGFLASALLSTIRSIVKPNEPIEE